MTGFKLKVHSKKGPNLDGIYKVYMLFLQGYEHVVKVL